MPGSWPTGHIARLFRQLPTSIVINDPESYTELYSPTATADYEPLRKALRWDLVTRVLDPWAGEGVTRSALGDLVAVALSDLRQRRGIRLQPLHALANALESSDLNNLEACLGPFTGIVASPWFAFLDVALAAAVSVGYQFVAFHVPGHYLTSAHPSRASYLQRVAEEGRLLILSNLPRASFGGRCGWLIIFKTPELRRLLVTQDTQLRCRAWILLDSACETVV